MTRDECLEQAAKAVGSRPRNYGKPESSFSRIAELWNSHLVNSGCQNFWLTSTDVATMMVLLKIARLQSTPNHTDSWVDIAGYAACGAEVATDNEPVWLEDIMQRSDM